MIKVNRRQFLKILGLGGAIATVTPKVVFEEIVKKQYSFVPGQLYRNMFIVPSPTRLWTESDRLRFVGYLDEWLRNKIHPDYLDFNKVEYFYQDSDYDSSGGVDISYLVPEKPISERERKLKKIDSVGIRLRSIDL